MKVLHILIMFILFGALQMQATDQDANALFRDALTLDKQKDYKEAAEKFLEAEHMADSTALKANAVTEAMKSYRKAKLKYDEFKCIEKLIDSYPDHINFEKLIEREYQLANDFFKGHRDPAYWSLGFIPWLTGKDKTLLIYEKALKHAPFSKRSPQARLRIARIYIDDGQTEKSLKVLREMIRLFPDEPLTKYAYLELGNALFQLSERGDGDGHYNRETIAVFKEFIKKYPDAPEIDLARKYLLRARDISAKRLYSMAKYYNRVGRKMPAERYLNDVLTDYSDTQSVNNSERLLTKIDKTYVPSGFRPPLKSRNQSFTNIAIPKERSKTIAIPEASGGKWMLPVRDLGLGNREEISKLQENESK